MQQRLGVATRLRQTLEHQFGRSLVGIGSREVASQLRIELVARVLLVHYRGRAFEGFGDLGFGFADCQCTITATVWAVGMANPRAKLLVHRLVLAAPCALSRRHQNNPR